MGKGNFTGGGHFGTAVFFLLADAFGRQFHGADYAGSGNCTDEPLFGTAGAV